MSYRESFNQTASTYTPNQSQSSEFKPITSGKFKATIARCSINDLTERVEFDLIISDTEFKGRHVWPSFMLNHKVGQQILIDALTTLGQAAANFDQVEAALDKLTGANVNIFIKYKPGKDKTGVTKEYMQVYFNGIDNDEPQHSSDLPF